MLAGGSLTAGTPPFGRLSGVIPPSLGHSTDLAWLDLSSNSLASTIPASMGSLTALQSLLLLSDNDLVGTVPQSLANLTNLQFLSLANNRLSGGFPSWASSSSLSTLRVSGRTCSLFLCFHIFCP